MSGTAEFRLVVTSQWKERGLSTLSTLAVSVVFPYLGKIALCRCLDSTLKVSNKQLSEIVCHQLSIEAVVAELLPIFEVFPYKKKMCRALLLFAY